MKNKIILWLLTFSLIFSPSFSYAAVANQNINTDSSVQEIEGYNRQVTEHNEAEVARVLEEIAYNEQRAEEAYNQNLEIDQQNAQIIEQANQAKQNNEQKIKEKKEYDALIDQEYKEAVLQEQIRVDEYNAQEDKRVEQAIQNNLEKQNTYNSELEQYNKDLEQYNIDKKMEEKILNAGYASVEQYNNMIKTKYNDKADAAIEENIKAKDIENPTTIIVTESNKAGRTYKVCVTHNYEANNEIVDTRTDIYEIDLNDIVTVYADGYFYNTITPTSALFYRYVSDNLLQGYWAESYSQLEHNTLYTLSNWNNGDTHIFSYKDGGKYGIMDDVYLSYNYMWISLPKYKTYNIPVLPTEPIKPELEDENPNYIIPSIIERKPYMEIELEDENYTLIPYVSPTYKEITPADLWDYLLMSSIENSINFVIEPFSIDIDPIEDTTSINYTNSILRASINKESLVQENTELKEDLISAEIVDNETPLTVSPQERTKKWALLNLIFMILNILFLITFPKKKDKDNDYIYTDRSNLIGVFCALISIIVFILTENIYLSMVLTDSWTLLMFGLTVGGLSIKILNRPKKEENKK